MPGTLTPMPTGHEPAGTWPLSACNALTTCLATAFGGLGAGSVCTQVPRRARVPPMPTAAVVTCVMSMSTAIAYGPFGRRADQVRRAARALAAGGHALLEQAGIGQLGDQCADRRAAQPKSLGELRPGQLTVAVHLARAAG